MLVMIGLVLCNYGSVAVHVNMEVWKYGCMVMLIRLRTTTKIIDNGDVTDCPVMSFVLVC